MASCNRKPYIKLSELTTGIKVKVDDGFTCIKPGTITHIFEDKNGYYFKCSEGEHYILGQISEEDWDSLIGLYKI